MAKKFQTVLRKARFVVDGYTPETMAAIGGRVRDSIDARLGRGMNVLDQPAKPLAPGYAKYKQRRRLQPIRDWFKTGRTRRSMKVVEAATNKAKIGFTDAVTALRAALNNRRERTFGVSPSDREELVKAVREADRPVKARVA